MALNIDIDDLKERIGNDENYSLDEKMLLLNGIKTLRLVVQNQYGPFICGVGGEKDDVGLHETYFVCPLYGKPGFAVYKKIENYTEPGY